MSTEEETEYKKLWNKIRENLNITAKEYVPQLYDLLKQEGYTPKEAREKIKKDAFNIWKAETVDKWIPQEAKQRIKILAGQKGAIAKTELEKADSVRFDLADKDDDINKDSPATLQQPPAELKDEEEAIPRTPESPDHSMVEQLNHINIQLKKKIEDLEKLMEIRMADKDQRIEQFTILNIRMKKDVDRLMDENIRLKQDLITVTNEKRELEKELEKYRRLEELRLEAQRKAIKEWRNPGDKP